MKTSASKGRSNCHSTPASVHAICFMPFEVDLFMATTQSLNFIWQRWQWLIHSPESMKSSASKGRNRCSWQVWISQFYMAKVAIRYSLFPYHHLPLIAKIDSKSKQFRLMFRTTKIDSKSKQIYGSKNNFAWRRRWARWRDRLWILPAGGGWALDLVCATACPALDLDCWRQLASGSCLGDGVPSSGSWLLAAAGLWLLPGRDRVMRTCLWCSNICPIFHGTKTNSNNILKFSSIREQLKLIWTNETHGNNLMRQNPFSAINNICERL